jgi:hypothetical protein
MGGRGRGLVALCPRAGAARGTSEGPEAGASEVVDGRDDVEGRPKETFESMMFYCQVLNRQKFISSPIFKRPSGASPLGGEFKIAASANVEKGGGIRPNPIPGPRAPATMAARPVSGQTRTAAALANPKVLRIPPAKRPPRRTSGLPLVSGRVSACRGWRADASPPRKRPKSPRRWRPPGVFP